MVLEYAGYETVLNELDKLIKDPGGEDYRRIRAILEKRLKYRETRNPFGAGAPRKYDDDVAERAADLRRQGKSYKAISEALGVPKSTIERMLKRD